MTWFMNNNIFSDRSHTTKWTRSRYQICLHTNAVLLLRYRSAYQKICTLKWYKSLSIKGRHIAALFHVFYMFSTHICVLHQTKKQTENIRHRNGRHKLLLHIPPHTVLVLKASRHNFLKSQTQSSLNSIAVHTHQLGYRFPEGMKNQMIRIRI